MIFHVENHGHSIKTGGLRARLDGTHGTKVIPVWRVIREDGVCMATYEKDAEAVRHAEELNDATKGQTIQESMDEMARND